MPENGNLPAQANPGSAGKMKSRQISLALFIKFDNRYRPPERQKRSAACRLEGGGGEYSGDPSKAPCHSGSLCSASQDPQPSTFMSGSPHASLSKNS